MNMSKEPAAIISTITSIVAAVLILLVEFGVPLTDGQQTAIQGLVAALAPIIAGLIIRSKVFAPDTVAKIAQASADPRYDPANPAEVPPNEWAINRPTKATRRDGSTV